jgi:FkbM family methyltransferase
VYSQNKEEGVINSLFGDWGKFLDVGAFDGKTFSNTLKLYERGWTGVLVEPSPPAFAGLKRQYEGSNRVALVNAAISQSDEELDFYDSNGDAISSTSLQHKERWEKGYKCTFTPITVRGMTWATLFKLHGTDYDFVNIDTEGTNLLMVQTFPFENCIPMCMCIEHDSKIGEMMDVLEKRGYRTVYQSGENIVVYRGPR